MQERECDGGITARGRGIGGGPEVLLSRCLRDKNDAKRVHYRGRFNVVSYSRERYMMTLVIDTACQFSEGYAYGRIIQRKQILILAKPGPRRGHTRPPHCLHCRPHFSLSAARRALDLGRNEAIRHHILLVYAAHVWSIPRVRLSVRISIIRESPPPLTATTAY